MYVILSQKIDTESSYEDELYKVYHYPARYKNALHEGDQFIYYQGNRYVKAHRYYFGTGTVGKIRTDDNENYYAELNDCYRFENIVPIYYDEVAGSYIEQLGYEGLREKPPWQSSVRPLSEKAFEYIIENAGGITPVIKQKSESELKDELKAAVRSFYRDEDEEAIHEIFEVAGELIKFVEKKKGY